MKGKIKEVALFELSFDSEVKEAVVLYESGRSVYYHGYIPYTVVDFIRNADRCDYNPVFQQFIMRKVNKNGQ